MPILDGYSGKVKRKEKCMGKKVIKNKEIPVAMLVGNVMNPKIVQGIAIVTNDEKGKTLTLSHGLFQTTIAFEQVEKYLK